MPVAPTYPGVYIEEIGSGVHTITGVATSITAFVGYTQRGDVDHATHIFSFADFERAFGGVTVDSPLSHAVKHFFQNGGTEAHIVRAAHGAAAASVTLKNSTTGGVSVLELTATSEGVWGNNLRIDVGYATENPASLFNLGVTELVERNGEMVPARTESFGNLSMDSRHPNYAESVVNARSQLVDAARPVFAFSGAGKSTSAVLAVADNLTGSPLPPAYRLAYMLNGQGPFEITISAPTAPGATLASALTAISTDVVTAINATSPPGVTAATPGGNTLEFTATTDGTHLAEQSSIHFIDASRNSQTARLKLGTSKGGVESDAAGAFRPAPSGTVGASGLPVSPDGTITIEVFGGISSVKPGIVLPLWGNGTTLVAPQSREELVTQIQAALSIKADTEPLLKGVTVQLVGTSIQLRPGGADPNVSFRVTGASATTLGLDAAGARNVSSYAPGLGATALAQILGAAGNNGTAPLPAEIQGNQLNKTGLYALENVDLFNLLVIPEATMGSGMAGVLSESLSYCAQRRAFMIIDVPENTTSFEQAQQWAGSSASPFRSRNSGLFFPRLRMPDPLNPSVLGTYGAAGALAGLFARTDADRGVWKAPAGTTATLVGATGLSYTLNDRENGTLNPLAINCLRTFPVIGTVNWGARTGRGADALADEYKYIPVRRLALFLEESLYRGTQWAVFEPNDEPLWAQIRLNLGAFMHTLFAQGAFQGKTPRDAYFVKCDKETTTQNDIDLGRVNIVVGFAPLKPAEFVVIQIQQIAGAIQT
ncbi:MAG: phage tail sheath subtilisin-like domain-containing protein [Nocardioides sp.]|nr:phage tail sheath subtilisin-like domain-containing protein [Nocardioides sp.]